MDDMTKLTTELFKEKIPKKITGHYSYEEICDFLLGKKKNPMGYEINWLRMMNEEQKEKTHDYIQWMFPLQERSQYCMYSPVLSKEVIEKLKENEAVKSSMLLSFYSMLSFWGFSYVDLSTMPYEALRKEKIVILPDNSNSSFGKWISKRNHNYKRITRVLKSLRLFGLEEYADAFESALECVFAYYSELIGEETMQYWKSA